MKRFLLIFIIPVLLLVSACAQPVQYPEGYALSEISESTDLETGFSIRIPTDISCTKGFPKDVFEDYAIEDDESISNRYYSGLYIMTAEVSAADGICMVTFGMPAVSSVLKDSLSSWSFIDAPVLITDKGEINPEETASDSEKKKYIYKLEEGTTLKGIKSTGIASYTSRALRYDCAKEFGHRHSIGDYVFYLDLPCIPEGGEYEINRTLAMPGGSLRIKTVSYEDKDGIKYIKLTFGDYTYLGNGKYKTTDFCIETESAKEHSDTVQFRYTVNAALTEDSRSENKIYDDDGNMISCLIPFKEGMDMETLAVYISDPVTVFLSDIYIPLS